MDIQSIVWLALLVLFLAVELATMGLTTIWFAGGALAAFLVSLAGGSILIQVLVFLAVAVILLIFTRPFAMKYINQNRVRTNADSLIGKTAVVTEQIDNLAGQGQARVNGQIWTARAKEENQKIPMDTRVTILEISGVKLIVEPEKESSLQQF